MPELPEIETVRRILEERIKGKTVASYAVGRPTFYRPPPAAALQGLVGRTVEAVERRGKYLLLKLSGGKTLSLHLGMSGRLVLGGAGPHLRFRLAVGEHMVNFHDARRFGRVGCSLPELGPEPLSGAFDARYLRRALKGRRAPIKALLMDQALVAGIGNIYATEALYAAGIRPMKPGGALSLARLESLCRAIKEILSRAVELGGSTLEDEAYLNPLGNPGRAQEIVSVYGRKIGRCGHALKATRRPLAGRTSLYCPVCQR
ncbi:MAG: bifunctional DNA-formamidopyrimidine glycosylase/DNA-(apurinic or apyrimidinic site) lyase [Elusimicrobia bacterium]|nr:bifunctional DNA-formamidopyrimidine glycosylase/DNA-(apurinic or apyrimidinic site) lyase [Elusimicrobiota bacterium]